MDLLTDTYSEEWRHECEIRHIAKMPLQERRKYLVLVMERRGMPERKRIENSLYVLWERRKNET